MLSNGKQRESMYKCADCWSDKRYQDSVALQRYQDIIVLLGTGPTYSSTNLPKKTLSNGTGVLLVNKRSPVLNEGRC